MIAEKQGDFTAKLSSILQQAGNINMSAINEYTWISTDSQVSYSFPITSTYSSNAKWLRVYVGGVPVDTSLVNNNFDSKFELLIDPVSIKAGTTVLAQWIEPIAPIVPTSYKVIPQQATPPADAEEGDLWFDTTDNTYQGTIFSGLNTDLQQRGINVKVLGAKGDGVTDDTVIIQNAINTYDKIYIPDGTYLVTNLTVPSNKVIIGQSMYKTILYSVSSGYILTTVDKAYMLNINNLSLKSNNTSSGIHVVCSDNTGLTEFDIAVNIEDVYMKNFGTYGVYLDASARECRITNVRCYYGGTAFYIAGTDNFIERCTAGAMSGKGYYLGANNKANNCKAFMCGSTSGDHGFHVTNYCNLTNTCAQQNYAAGIYVEGDSNYIDIVSDSNGVYNNFVDLTYGISVNGRFNEIRGTVVDGRLGGNTKAALNLTNNAVFNSIDITYKVIENKPVYDNDSFQLVSAFQTHLNNVTINATSIMKIADIAFTELKNMSYTTQLDNAAGSVSLTGNVFQVNMVNYQSLASGWGNTVRFDVVPLNTTSKKYMVVKGQIKVTGDTYGYGLTMMGGSSAVTGTARIIICPQIVSRQYVDFYCVYDMVLLPTQVTGAKLWLGLFKNTASSVGTSISAYFKDVKIYFTD
jgi:hypothetical protein